jgi:NADH-quinone oxidoreductase subunit I
VRRLFPVRGGVPGRLHLYRSRRETAELRISGGERYAKVYNIDYNRCIFCGFCVEACPTDAITHGHGFEIASYNTSTLIYRKEQMLVQIPTGAHFPLKAESAPSAGGH